ncbi:MAG: hypothetical protein GF308_18050 [Candidatus Heimdallarchaeota archaeon]|nr:hypothetical protein [Candidatus Heimdallarchaeota archaeon]
MEIHHLEEVKLKFGQGVKAYDPRKGLLKGGPYGPSGNEDQLDFKIINCGVIATSPYIAKTRHFIEKISFGFDANSTTYGDLGFPGLGKRSPLLFSLKVLKQWEEKILDHEIRTIENISDKNQRKNKLFEIIETKIQNIVQVDPPPHLIFITLNEKIINLFRRPGIYSDDIIFANRNYPDSVYESEGDIDFHNIVKILGMKYDIRTQLLKPTTLTFEGTEDQVTTSWNLAVGLYYKANGIPWRFSEFENDVCYVGISFFRDFSEEEVYMNSSMAQVFLHTGENYILRGDKFQWERTKRDRNPHLDEGKAESLINKIVDLYYSKKNTYPSRMVIYKTSNFHPEEINGFYKNKGKIRDIDMITIIDRKKFRLYRHGNYPVMRGTMISTEERKRCFLYTYGYLPPMETYPGMKVPSPLEVKQFTGNADIKKICKEILTLTRLDWNNIKYCQKMPVTLAFAKKVGEILSERRSEDISNIKIHYRYYM